MTHESVVDAEALLGAVYVWDDQIPNYAVVKALFSGPNAEPTASPRDALLQWRIFQFADPQEVDWNKDFLGGYERQLTEKVWRQLPNNSFLYQLFATEASMPKWRALVRKTADQTLDTRGWEKRFASGGVSVIESLPERDRKVFFEGLAHTENVYAREWWLDALSIMILRNYKGYKGSWVGAYLDRLFEQWIWAKIMRCEELGIALGEKMAVLPEGVLPRRNRKSLDGKDVDQLKEHLGERSQRLLAFRAAYGALPGAGGSLYHFSHQLELFELSRAAKSGHPDLIILLHVRKLQAFFYDLRLIACAHRVPALRRELEGQLLDYSTWM